MYFLRVCTIISKLLQRSLLDTRDSYRGTESWKPQTRVRALGGHQQVGDLGKALPLSGSPTTGHMTSTPCQSACFILPYQ